MVIKKNIKKLKYPILLSFLLITISITTAHAQTLAVDVSVGDMEEIEKSKYKTTGVSVVRNSDGELISVIRVDASRYLEHPIIDEFLNADPKNLVKEGMINDQKVKMYNIIAEYEYPECLSELYAVPGYDESCNWYHRAFVSMLGVSDEDEGLNYTIFRGLNHAFTIRQLDQVTTFWTIFSND